MVLDISMARSNRGKTFIEREGHRVDTDRTGIVTVDGVPRTQYPCRTDYFFMMGDNRDTQPRQQILGICSGRKHRRQGDVRLLVVGYFRFRRQHRKEIFGDSLVAHRNV